MVSEEGEFVNQNVGEKMPGFDTRRRRKNEWGAGASRPLPEREAEPRILAPQRKTRKHSERSKMCD